MIEIVFLFGYLGIGCGTAAFVDSRYPTRSWVDVLTTLGMVCLWPLVGLAIILILVAHVVKNALR